MTLFADDKVWDHQPELWEVTEYLIDKLKKVIPKGFNWAISEHRSYIQYFKGIDTGNGTDEFIAMPLEWLPILEQKNEKLHWLVIVTIAQIYKVINPYMLVESHFDDMIISDWENRLDEELDVNDYGSRQIATIDYQKYQDNGIVQRYYRLITNNRVSREEVITQIKGYRPRTPLQRSFKRWLMTAIPVLENPVKLCDYAVYVETDDGEPLTVFDAVHFCWSFHDTVGYQVEQWRDDHYQNFGFTEPCLLGTINPKEHDKPKPAEKLVNIYKFFRAGRTMYWRHYEPRIKRFYDRRRNTEPI